MLLFSSRYNHTVNKVHTTSDYFITGKEKLVILLTVHRFFFFLKPVFLFLKHVFLSPIFPSSACSAEPVCYWIFKEQQFK